jgi:hypothetical protein
VFERPHLTPDKPTTGRKFDAGKVSWTLLTVGCRLAVNGALRVLMYGMKLHGRDNWQQVEWVRYLDALYRHLDTINRDGLTAVDDESGELHAHHVTTNALFIAHFAQKAADLGTRPGAVLGVSHGPVVTSAPADGGYPFPAGYVPRRETGSAVSPTGGTTD